MTGETTAYVWNPLPGRLPPELDQEFAVYSLGREVEQTRLVFSAFAVMSGCNLIIDIIYGMFDFMLLNGFFFALAVTAASTLTLIQNHRILTIIVNIVAFLVCSSIVLAKLTAVSTEIWFMYLADLMIIAAICLTVPVNLLLKAGYSLIIIAMNVESLAASPITGSTQAGVILLLVATMVFSLIVYYKMQQAHFSAFMSLRKEQQTNEKLRTAHKEIGELKKLLPVCSSCKIMVRGENGDWDQIDIYIQDHLDVNVSHGLCPGCFSKMYPDVRR